MTTLLEMRDQVLRLLGDPNGVLYDSDLIDDAIRESHDAILPWVYKPSVATLTGNGSLVAWSLPADFYRVIGVLDDENSVWVPENSLAANTSRSTSRVVNNDWMMFPSGMITLANAINVGFTFTVHYAAMWTKPIDEESVLTPPAWVKMGMIYFSASYTLIKEAANAANVRQWNRDIDSGTPLMNPMKDMSDALHKRFIEHMNMNPSYQKGARS